MYPLRAARGARMEPEILEEILSCPTLPSLPAVAVRVIELTHNSNTSLDELALTIQNDQALAAKVLRTVNSSFYGLRRRCSTIQQSLVVLGLSTVKSLALGFSLVQCIHRGAGEGFDFVAYWRRALYTAIGARAAARAVGKKFEDEAFLAGLLQDVGMVAMHAALGSRYAEVLGRCGAHTALVAAELESLDVQHPDIGAILAQRWRLPAELVIPVKYHERPTAAPREHAECTKCVALGNLIHDVLTEKDATRALRIAYARGRAWLDLDPGSLDELVREVGSSARELSSLFTLETGEYKDADAVIRAAEKALLELSHADEQGEDVAMAALLQEHCRTDPETGAVCKDEFVFEVRSAFDRAVREGEPLSIAIVLLDDPITSPRGGEASRRAEWLRGVAVILRKHFDPTGAVIGRWAAGAFAVLIPGAGTVAASKLADLARADLGRGMGESGGSASEASAYTASIGIASLEPRLDTATRVELLLAASMRAAELAQAAGGNQVRSYRGDTRRAA